MIKKYLKGCLIAIASVAGVLVIGFGILVFLFRYTSPVHEAGREYTREVDSYKKKEIGSMEDVFARLALLDSHYNSTTFDKVQGGEKTEVTLSDIETLFGEPDQMLEDLEMGRVNKVYKYNYEDLTLNFHQDYYGVEEYVIENYSEVMYESQHLDQLFFDTLNNHQSQYNKVNEEFELLSEENVSSLIEKQIPTRKVYQSGWFMWPANPRYYFDDGTGDYSPEEYLVLLFNENENNDIILYVMERQYHDTYLQEETEEEIEQQKEAKYEIVAIFDEEETENTEEKLIVSDFSHEFGDIARLSYDFREGVLEISWLIIEDEWTEEIIARIPVTEENIPTNPDELANLEVAEIDFDRLYYNEQTLYGSFIGSR